MFRSVFYVDQSGIEADRIGTHRIDPNENSIKLSNVFAFLLCKFNNFVNTPRCRIHLVYVHYIYNTCALWKHIGNMCTRLRNGGIGEALPSLFPRFAPNTHIYLYASTVHKFCIYPAILNRK